MGHPCTLTFARVSPDAGAPGLTWAPRFGVGYLHVQAPATEVYDRSYFEKYQTYAETELGVKLNHERTDFVHEHWQGDLVDVGIGAGQFMRTWELRTGWPCWGFDVNTYGLRLLHQRARYLDPYAEPVDAVTLWDVLEHIPNPSPLLDNVRRWCFVSLPVFSGLDHVLTSKHLRPDEHCWYFRRDGLVRFMAAHGFTLAGSSDVETRLGREDVLTFAFKRSDI